MPTVDEKRWMREIQDLGCIACIVDIGIYGSPSDVHHLLSGGRRKGNLYTLPLCPPHHRGGRDDKDIVSRDHSQRRFEARYGTEEALLTKTRELVKRRTGWAPTLS